MIIRRITEYERDVVRAFYLALSPEDRRKRFCSMISDDTLSRYVEGLDFMRRTVLGAFNEHAQLTGLAELASTGAESELAFAVRPDMRRRRIGTSLMEHILLDARMSGIAKVFVIFLSDNLPMRRLAQNAGMIFKTEGGETYASRDLTAPSADELSRWFVQETFAHGEYFSVLGIERWRSLLTGPGLGSLQAGSISLSPCHKINGSSAATRRQYT